MYDRIYTVGCFDWFHEGHLSILTKMKQMGHTLIVGVHDDNSIEKLKKLSTDEHQTIYQRVENVKTVADVVYVVPDTDPTFFLRAVVQDTDSKDNACFVRASDTVNFPGRTFIESKMDIKFIEYTKGVSSTQIRKNMKKTGR